MKRDQCIIGILVLFAVLLLPDQKLRGQCAVDYTTQNYFCDLDSLLLSAVPISGTPPYSFIWETGETTQTIMIPLALGDYMLTMTDANGCTAIINCHIKPFPQVLYYPYNQNACEGDTVTLFLEWFRDSIPGALYEWSTGETTPTIQLTDDLVWSVTVTDPSNGCEFIIPAGLFDFHPTPWPVINGPNVICSGQTITLSVTGGPFGSVIWYPEGYWGETYEVSEPGTYIVWASSPEAGYCWHQDTITITEDDLPQPILSGPPDLCTGQTGTISVTNYTLYQDFIWSNGITTPSFTVTAPGTYTVTVTAQGGCTASESISVGAGTGPDLSAVVTGTTCGESNGSIDLTASPPQAFTYAWSNGASTPDLSNIIAGIYSVTVTDVDGCTAVLSETVPDNPISITVNAIITPNTNCTNFNGAIDISVTPVTEIYSYQWSNGSSTEDLQNLLPGSYTVTVSTGQNCNTSATFVIDDLSGAAEIFPAITNTTCGESNGSISIQLQGGQGPFTYLWSNGNTTEMITNVPAGPYGITVTGADGCISIASIDLENDDPPIAVTGIVLPNTSCTGSNGEIDVSVSPPGTYDFNWSNGVTSEDIFNLPAGTYTLTVTLGISCIEVADFTVINENIPFDITGLSFPNSSCTTPNGSIDLTVIPTGAYTFDWSTGETTEDLQDLDAGNYTVTVTDDAGCSISSSFPVVNSLTLPVITGFSINNTSCQVPNGIIDIAVSPPDTYTFLWSNGADTEDLQNLSGGSYSVTVTSTAGCTADTFFILSDQNILPSVTGVSQDNTSCISPNGSIDITVTPLGTYTFNWSNGQTTEDIQSLQGGTFSVTVTDPNSCSVSDTFIVNENTVPPIITSMITDEVCSAGNGSIDISSSPPGNTFLWSSGSTAEDLLNLAAGSYSLTVTAPNGCTASDTFNISNTSNNFSLSALISDNTSCISPNGSIDLAIIPSGSYMITWSNGSTSEDLNGLSAGTFTVTVTDNAQCSSTASFNILNNTLDPIITEIITPATCGQLNGSIQLDITPPTGNAFLWSNGYNGKDLINVAAGTYSITVTGSNGCSATAGFNIPDNNTNFSASANIQDNNSCTIPDGFIELSVTPSGSYTYLWSNGFTSASLYNLSAGNYNVTITDQFNCTLTQDFVIADNTILPELVFSVTPANCGNPDGSIDLTVNLSTGNTYVWSNGMNAEDLVNILPGSYSVTVTGSNGCSATGIIDVPNQNTNFTLSGAVTDHSSCTAPSGSIDVSVSPIGSYFFQWSNGNSSEDQNNLAPGIYEVTVTDAFGCSTSEIFIVEDATNTLLLSEVITSASCGQSNGRIDLTILPASNYSFAWSNGSTAEDLNGLNKGNYSVTVSDDNGCSITGNFSVPGTDPVNIILDADLTNWTINETVICSLLLNIPLDAIDTIMWYPYDMMSCQDAVCMEQIFTMQEPTEISVIVMDTNGCQGTANLMLDIGVEYKVYIPNVFTPNNDGPNDRFTVFTNEEVDEVVILEIFDRWGNKVFANESFPPNEPDYGWDGIFRGQMMNPAVFAYRAVVRFSNGEEASYKGDVTLVR